MVVCSVLGWCLFGFTLASVFIWWGNVLSVSHKGWTNRKRGRGIQGAKDMKSVYYEGESDIFSWK